MAVMIGLEVLLILGLVIANGIFAMSEIAIVSARKPRLERLAESGNERAQAALRLASSPDRFLSTVQIGITMIGVLAGAFGGATIAEQIDEALERIPLLGPYSEAIGLGVVVLGITYLTIVIGELVPKRIALNAPERLAASIAPAMELLSRLAAPAVNLLSGSTRMVLRILRIPVVHEPPVTEEELKLMLREGTRAGTIEREERVIVERVFRLGDRSVRAVMNPRVDMEWIEIDTPLPELRERLRASSHSRFPVGEGDVDHIVGILHAKDLWAIGGSEGAMSVRDLIKAPLFVPENTPAFRLLEQFRATRNHVAIVMDEYGTVEGIVTPADILEALVGELPEPGDRFEPSIVTLADGSFSVDAHVDLEEVKIILGLTDLPGQKENAFQTVAGYLIDRIGHMPRIGESFIAAGFRFEVVDTDGRRIDRIRVSADELGEGEG